MATPPLSPLLGLPAECILLILHYVECPHSLAKLRRVCRHIYQLLSDTGRANDEAIWRPCAHYLLHEFCPTSLNDARETSWQAYVKRTVNLSKVPLADPKKHLSFKRPSNNDSDSDTEEDTRQPTRYDPKLVSTTECGPRFLGEDVPGLEVDYASAIPELPRNAEIQFVHSSTEAHRAIESATPYCSVNGRFVTFSDEPMYWDWSPRDHAHMVVDPRKENPFRVIPDKDNIIERLQDAVAEPGVMTWIQSSLLSDADLILIPKEISADSQQSLVERRPVIRKVCRLAADGKNEPEWNLSSMKSWRQYCLDPDLKPRKPEDELDQEFEFRQTTWEFRSAGDCLVVADDNNGESPTTLTCFSASKTDGFLWQRIMMSAVVDEDVEDGHREIFYDNDGFRVTPTFIIYATRAHLTRGQGHFFKKNTVAAEFHLLSPQNGDTIRILDFDLESRKLDKKCYMSTSFTVSDSLVIATMAGEARGHLRYRWREALVWDLADKSTERQLPSATIPLPTWWEDDYQNSEGLEVYTTISPDGRLILFTAAWEAQVWDWEKKECIGYWEVHNNEAWEMRNEMDQGDYAESAVEGWNGVWVGYYHDAFETDMKTVGKEEKKDGKVVEPISSTSSEKPAERKRKTPVKHNNRGPLSPPPRASEPTAVSRPPTPSPSSSHRFNLAYFPATHVRAAIRGEKPPHPGEFDTVNWPPVPPDTDWAHYDGPELANVMLQYALSSGLLVADNSDSETGSESDSDSSGSSGSSGDSLSGEEEDGDSAGASSSGSDNEEGSGHSGNNDEFGSGGGDDDSDGGQMGYGQSGWEDYEDETVYPDDEQW